MLTVVEDQHGRTLSEETQGAVGWGAARLVKEAEGARKGNRYQIGMGDRR